MFSGIGGLDLGLEWGIKDAETVWQIEMEPFGRSILAKHWPDASREVTDVREGNAENLAPVDLISGGFPCQDISVAGNQKGFSGEKSSLWYEMARIVGELRPRFIVLENVAAITSPNMRRIHGRVLSDVSALGYHGEWHRVSAAQVGAPHLRNRWFFIGWRSMANAESAGREIPTAFPVVVPTKITRSTGDGQPMANAESARRERPEAFPVVVSQSIARPPRSGSDVANADSAQRAGAEAVPSVLPQEPSSTSSSGEQIGGPNHWHVEPPVGRVVNGISKRLSRRNRHALRALGNAVVPQCAELVGRRVQEIREILNNE